MLYEQWCTTAKDWPSKKLQTQFGHTSKFSVLFYKKFTLFRFHSSNSFNNKMNFVHRSYNGPYRNSPEHKGSSQRNCSRGAPVSPGLDFEDESHSKYVSDVGRNKNYETPEDSEVREWIGLLLENSLTFINSSINSSHLLKPEKNQLIDCRQFAQISDEPETFYYQL